MAKVITAAPTAPKGPPPNTTETAAADDTFEVTVPEGVKPGEVLHANTPGGVKVRLALCTCLVSRRSGSGSVFAERLVPKSLQS